MRRKKELSAKQILKIEKTLAMGKAKFVIFSGVIGWGLLTASLFTIFNYYSGNKISFISFITFPIGGIFYGLWMWSYINKLYKKNKN